MLSQPKLVLGSTPSERQPACTSLEGQVALRIATIEAFAHQLETADAWVGTVGQPVKLFAQTSALAKADALRVVACVLQGTPALTAHNKAAAVATALVMYPAHVNATWAGEVQNALSN
mmetsp:Transcript_2917/g.5267  ORF Transcript_2917/g.5267 Transcript_2917/m.5267 type:complete len:118 (+) Transcript_2917:654-1007(+)